MRMRNLLTLLLTLLITSATFAQSTKVAGRVMDTSGSVMPGVQVKVYQGDAVVKEGLTTATGDFELPVNPGDYKLEITAPDFTKHDAPMRVRPPITTLLRITVFAPIDTSGPMTQLQPIEALGSILAPGATTVPVPMPGLNGAAPCWSVK